MFNVQVTEWLLSYFTVEHICRHTWDTIIWLDYVTFQGEFVVWLGLWTVP